MLRKKCLPGRACIQIHEDTRSAYCVPCSAISTSTKSGIIVIHSAGKCNSPEAIRAPSYLDECIYKSECEVNQECVSESWDGTLSRYRNPTREPFCSSSSGCYCLDDTKSCFTQKCLSDRACIQIRKDFCSAYCVPCSAVATSTKSGIVVRHCAGECNFPEATKAPSYLDECVYKFECDVNQECVSDSSEICSTTYGCFCLSIDEICTETR